MLEQEMQKVAISYEKQIHVFSKIGIYPIENTYFEMYQH